MFTGRLQNVAQKRRRRRKVDRYQTKIGDREEKELSNEHRKNHTQRMAETAGTTSGGCNYDNSPTKYYFYRGIRHGTVQFHKSDQRVLSERVRWRTYLFF